jgi:hypothetical protein
VAITVVVVKEVGEGAVVGFAGLMKVGVMVPSVMVVILVNIGRVGGRRLKL